MSKYGALSEPFSAQLTGSARTSLEYKYTPVSPLFPSFDAYNDLPTNKIKLIISQKVKLADQVALQHLEKAIQREANSEQAKYQKLLETIGESQAGLRKRSEVTRGLELKSGVVRVKSEAAVVPPTVSERLSQLSTPKILKRNHVFGYMDSYGLLHRNSKVAIDKVENHGLVMESTRDTVKKLKKRKCVRKSIEQHIILQEMKELNEFHRKFGELKGRVGFPRIQLSTLKAHRLQE